MYFNGTIRKIGEIDVSKMQKSILSIPEDAWELDWRKTKNLNFYDSHTVWMRSAPFCNETTLHSFDSSQTCCSDEFKNDYEEFHSDLENLLDGKIIRTAIIRLLPGNSVKKHIDGTHIIFRFCRRLIIPIISGQKATFSYDIDHVLEEGTIYDTNPYFPHSTFNGDSYARHQAVIDLFPLEIPNSIVNLKFYSWDQEKIFLDYQEKYFDSILKNRDRTRNLSRWKEIVEIEKKIAEECPYLSKFQ